MLLLTRGAATGVTGEICPPPTLKSRWTSYVLVPPHFYHNIYIDWLVPPYIHNRSSTTTSDTGA